MEISEILTNYRASVSATKQYACDAFRQDETGQYIYDEYHRGFIVDAAAIKFQVAWETFLESICVAYIMHKATLTGSYVRTFVSASDEEHAHKLLIGCNKYFDWANPQTVKQMSILFFGVPNPIAQNIDAIFTELFDYRTIRNAAAHLTTTTQKPLEALAQRNSGRMMNGITPSKLLFSPFPNEDNDYWTHYQNLFDIAAEHIAQGIC